MKNYNIKAALFDLDGVIVFTDKYHYQAWKKLAEENNWEFNEEINNRLRGIPRLASLEEILRYNHIELPMEEKILLMEKKNQYYVQLLEQINESDVYPGVIEFLKSLRAKGIRISLCSSSKNAMLVLKSLGIDNLFDAIVSGHDIKNAKPDPEIFLLGAQKLNTPEFHCVVFEDAKAGIEGAIAAKMKTVGVGNLGELEGLADQCIEKYEEIELETFLESGRVKSLIVDEDKIIEQGFNPKEVRHFESMFSLGNGYLGLRGTYDEADDGIDMCEGMYINGVYATEPILKSASRGYSKNNESTINLTDWRIFNLYIEGEKACFSANNIKEHYRCLDMQKGCIERSFVFQTASGKLAKVESVRVVNMHDIHTGEIRYTVTPLNFKGEVIIQSQATKLTMLNNKCISNCVEEKDNEGVFSCTLEAVNSGIKAVCAITHEVKGADYQVQVVNEENCYSYNVVANLKEHESLTVEKYAGFFTCIDKVNDIETCARNAALKCRETGFNSLLQTQTEFWKKHWEIGDVVIEGNLTDQQAVRFSLFQLRQQLAVTNQCSVGATGLTGPNYSGKVFWDTEMYLMPYYNFTNPESQKELLMYRYRILDVARARAKQFGGQGAMYAWASISGDETSTVFEASVAEYHLNSDIAYSIWRYYDSTGDKEFVYNYGAEIVFETAKFMSHRGNFIEARDGRFCINVVCGPDEYACGVSNNMYTNFMAQFHFRFALKLAEELKECAPELYECLAQKIQLTDVELERWQMAADKMYYRYNERYGIHEQDDSFVYKDPVDMDTLPTNMDVRRIYHPLDLWRTQVIKQADVVLLNFVQGDKFTFEEKMRDYDYYEPKCNHGSSLSTAIHSIMAAELGKPEAYEFFRCSAYMDISDFKKNTYDGLHMACLGGVWMTVVNGFLGMRHYIDGLHFNPQIPSAWNSYCLKLIYRGARMEVKVNHEEATFTLLSGESLSFKIKETDVTLSADNKSFVSQIAF